MLDGVFASLATSLSQALGGPYHDGTATWAGQPTYDDGGSITVAADDDAHDCLVQVDGATDAMRRAEGYVDRDVRLLILATSVGRPIDTSATVQVKAGPRQGLYSVQSAGLDPLGLAWECRGRPV